MNVLSRIALALVIIGALNWGLIGFFQFDLVATLFGGQDAFLSRVVYGLVGISGLACIGLLFKQDDEKGTATDRQRFSNPNYGTEFGEEPDFSKIRQNAGNTGNTGNKGNKGNTGNKYGTEFGEEPNFSKERQNTSTTNTMGTTGATNTMSTTGTTGTEKKKNSGTDNKN